MGKDKLGGECHIGEGVIISSSQDPSLVWWWVAFQRQYEQS